MQQSSNAAAYNLNYKELLTLKCDSTVKSTSTPLHQLQMYVRQTIVVSVLPSIFEVHVIVCVSETRLACAIYYADSATARVHITFPARVSSFLPPPPFTPPRRLASPLEFFCFLILLL